MATYVPDTRLRRVHVNPWLVATVLLTAVLVALTGWILWQGRETRSADQVLVDEMIAAVNSKDVEATGRLYTRDAVVTFGKEGPEIVGIDALRKSARAGVSRFTKVGEPTTLLDPPAGFTRPDPSVDQHYVVAPVLIHDDPFVVVLDVRDGKIATQMIFEPFEPLRS